MDSKTLSELKRQYGVLTTDGIAIRGDVDRIEAVRAVLGQLPSVKLKTRTGTLIHPTDALFRPEERDESAYLFDEENRWFEFHLGEDRGVIDFQSDFGISHLNVELGGATPRLSLSIFQVGLVCIEEGIEALRIYPIHQTVGRSA